jgi:hydroxyethylthiazole kinase
MTDLTAALIALRAKTPLVQNITNYVVMNNTANALLAVGASPAMVHAPEEAAEFATISSALVINIGTLSTPWVDGMTKAATAARDNGVPWILDPVGIGATAFRRATCAKLVTLSPAVIRGNASEIIALAGAANAGKGVDSTDTSEAAGDAARRLAAATGAVVAVTGKVDYVTDGERTIAIANGDVMLTRVTGTGCTATALIGAFLGARLGPMDAAVAGLATLGVAAEIAARKSSGPGSFQVALIDALYALDGATLAQNARVS